MLSSLIDSGLKIIDKIIPDKKAATEAKLKLMELEQNGELKTIAAQSKIITNETKSESILARNWRPIIMLIFGTILANNYIISPYLRLFGVPTTILTIPPNMWHLLELGLSGYIVGRSGEKMIKSWRNRN